MLGFVGFFTCFAGNSFGTIHLLGKEMKKDTQWFPFIYSSLGKFEFVLAGLFLTIWRSPATTNTNKLLVNPG